MPGVVIVLFDDASPNILEHCGETATLRSMGFDFTNNHITTPVCAPARASLLTGKYAHSNGVIQNGGPEGSYRSFLRNGNEDASLATVLDAEGVKVALYGKYINGYDPDGGGHDDWAFEEKHVPPGFTEWFAAGDPYQEFAYKATLKTTGAASKFTSNAELEGDYLTDKLNDLAIDFIDRRAGQDFVLILCPTATHTNAGGDDPEGPSIRYPAAPRDRPFDEALWPDYWDEPEFPDTGDLGPEPFVWPDPIDGLWFNRRPTDAPAWFPVGELDSHTLNEYKESHKQRIMQAQAVDDMIGDIRTKLAAEGIDDDTWIILTTDNGYHLGEHELPTGKGAPYWYDTRLPFIVVPPGGASPLTINEPISTVDIMPTLCEIFGVTPPSDMDGKSILGLAGVGEVVSPWRKTALSTFATPDFPTWDSAIGTGEPPGWFSLRDDTWLWTDYRPEDGSAAYGKTELYDVPGDPWLLENLALRVDEPTMAALHDMGRRYTSTHGEDCWAVGLDPIPTIVLGDPVTPPGDDELATRYFLNAKELSDYNISIFLSSNLCSIPPMRGDNLVIAGEEGRSENTGMFADQNEGTLGLWARGRENVAMAYRLIRPRGTLNELRTDRGGDTRHLEFQVPRGVAVTFPNSVQDEAFFNANIVVPGAYWTDVEKLSQTIELDHTDDNQLVIFDAFADGQAPVQNWKLIIAGSLITGPIRITDAIGEGWVQVDHNVGAEGSITFNSQDGEIILVSDSFPEGTNINDFKTQKQAGKFITIQPKQLDGSIQLRISWQNATTPADALTATLLTRRCFFQGL